MLYSHEHSVFTFVPIIKRRRLTALTLLALTLAAVIFLEVKESGSDETKFAKFQTYARNVKFFS